MSNHLEEVVFYHCTSTPLLKVVPSLLAKVYESKRNSLVLCDDQQHMEELNQQLWSFSTKIFIPHGSTADPHAQWQPVLLATELVDHNKPKVLVSFSDLDLTTVSHFQTLILIFFGNELDQIVVTMKQKFLDLKTQGLYKVKFWQQDFATTKWLQVP